MFMIKIWYIYLRYSSPLSDTGSVIEMPVPSSFNDITTDSALRDFVGWAWYDRQFFLPQSWNTSNQDVKIRFGSAHYTAMVWVNGVSVANHSGGHLPFEADLSQIVTSPGLNLLTVAINNTLSESSIPQGEWNWKEESDFYPAGYFEMTYTFDFFNYAGIHRPVILYTVPKPVSVKDVTVQTTVTSDLTQATVNFDVITEFNGDSPSCNVDLFDNNGTLVVGSVGCSGTLNVDSPNLWWPYLMNENPAYLYTLQITASNSGGQDIYRLPVGIRHLSWNSDSFQINYQDFYFRGFGKHEDSNIRGKGLDLALLTKDFNLIKWLGANSFRTSHYPYADEIMDFADR